MRASITSPQRTLRTLTALIKANEGEKLYLYLTVSKEAVNINLVREEEKESTMTSLLREQNAPGYRDRYPKLEKLALAFMVTSRKLRSYFHAHSIEV